MPDLGGQSGDDDTSEDADSKPRPNKKDANQSDRWNEKLCRVAEIRSETGPCSCSVRCKHNMALSKWAKR